MKALILKQLLEFWRRKYLVLMTFLITSIYPIIIIFKQGVNPGSLLFISVCLTAIFQTMASSQIQDEIANGFFSLMYAYPLRDRKYIESKFLFFTLVSIGILVFEIILLSLFGWIQGYFRIIFIANLLLYLMSLLTLSFYFRGHDKNPFLIAYQITFVAFIFSQTFSFLSLEEISLFLKTIPLVFLLGIGFLLSMVFFYGTKRLATCFYQEAKL